MTQTPPDPKGMNELKEPEARAFRGTGPHIITVYWLSRQPHQPRSKSYHFERECEARMFERSCKTDGSEYTAFYMPELEQSNG